MLCVYDSERDEVNLNKDGDTSECCANDMPPREGDVFRWTENPVKNPSFRVQIKSVLNHEI